MNLELGPASSACPLSVPPVVHRGVLSAGMRTRQKSLAPLTDESRQQRSAVEVPLAVEEAMETGNASACRCLLRRDRRRPADGEP